jgi:hypothetical protein
VTRAALVSARATTLVSRHFETVDDTTCLIALSIEQVTMLVLDSIEAGQEIERSDA